MKDTNLRAKLMEFADLLISQREPYPHYYDGPSEITYNIERGKVETLQRVGQMLKDKLEEMDE